MNDNPVYTHGELEKNNLFWIPSEFRNLPWAVFQNGKQICSIQPCSFLIQNTFPTPMFAQPEGSQDKVYGLSLAPGCEARIVTE